ncbi:unnamed protein product [Rotaria socialis]|uniref:Uncharacterized protein n=1 Tax=Rotaria socialis TaxID=392032 RepID=A0A821ANN8_9BILA|nr:unnamed protein product [Rotaria socialis]CAF3317398.1 unnamed protein product [Rotaria socialis]CAF3318641.1 unnamed protein product [Rotaria socialis]CAF3409332.1 unnamed protein product [Rotaria socialis]CAF3449123.1 unnamed protein product [Rotaria socialis]
MKLILCDDGIQSETKISLLIPSSIAWIDGILEQIESNDDLVVTRAGLWLDSLSHLAHRFSDIVLSLTMIHLNNRLSRDLPITNQYKLFLKQLCEPNPTKCMFTAKQHFYS